MTADLRDLQGLYDLWADTLPDGGGPMPGYGDTPHPVQVPGGPLYCSTCTTLVSAEPTFAWDTNGWYRLLGCDWPYRQSQHTLVKRYVARGGPDDARMTYVLSCLLDRPTRRRYDLTPLGSLFLQDEQVQRAIKDQANRRKAQEAARGVHRSDEEIAEDLGIVFVDEPGDVLDKPHDAVDDPSTRYSYLVKLMGDLPTFDEAYLEHLASWRSLILYVCHEVQLNISFSMGLMQESSNTFEVCLPDNREPDTKPNAIDIIVRTDQVPNLQEAKKIMAQAITTHPHLIETRNQ